MDTTASPIPLLDPEAFVRSLYAMLLKREPDAEGLESHQRFLRAGGAPEQLVESILLSDEYKDVSLSEELKSDRLFNERSQYGEITMLMEHIFHKSIRHKIIVDVGAHGTNISNSFDLVKKLKWKGVLIEADPGLIPIIRRDCADFDVDIINVAISNYDGDADFFVSDGRVLSSLNPAIMESLGYSPQSMVRVPVRRLAPLLLERAIPNDFDILSLDIEGEDVRTLNDLIDNSDYRPRWVIIEADHGFSLQALDKAEFSETVRSSYRVLGITFANILLELRES